MDITFNSFDKGFYLHLELCKLYIKMSDFFSFSFKKHRKIANFSLSKPGNARSSPLFSESFQAYECSIN